ncbi:MAG: dTDP-4-dehydrorhamnose reductase [Mesonia hippocampi]|uniref:dTDP-4-dehydrorhamnose reductase n=1 Tax=Mesonia hippocampi TaxID=1628250 RepID=UPI003F9CDD52
MKKVLVTGADGQLGKCFRAEQSAYPNIAFYFVNKTELDISSPVAVQAFFLENKFDYCINCAAYTDVETAEEAREQAFLVNAVGVENLAKCCRQNNLTLIHFSTDYVFDGTAKQPYSEADTPNPINVYGASKLKGENLIKEQLATYFIFRISWLYSSYNKNFYTSILNLANTHKTLNITTEQTGTPTNATDVAKMVLKLIAKNNTKYGVYHYTNKGQATWFTFAKEIVKNAGLTTKVNPVDYYPTKAKRPVFSVLDLTKFEKTFQKTSPLWEDSLRNLQPK